MFGACGHDSVVDREAGVFGDVQLPAELSDKRQAHGSHLEERDGSERQGTAAGMGGVEFISHMFLS